MNAAMNARIAELESALLVENERISFLLVELNKALKALATARQDGFKAGLEEAAQVCIDFQAAYTGKVQRSGPFSTGTFAPGALDCAEAIRALKSKEQA